MSGIGGLLSSKKGSLALIGAGMLWLSESGLLENPPSETVIYCGSGLFGLAIVCQTVLDAIDRLRVNATNE